MDKLGKVPRDSDILAAYRELVNAGKITADPSILKLLTTRGIRTLSGVTAMAVMTKPYVCPGLCTFCPLELGMPKSYLSDEPAALFDLHEAVAGAVDDEEVRRVGRDPQQQ